MLSISNAGSIAVVTPSLVHNTSRVSAAAPVDFFRITPTVSALSLSSAIVLYDKSRRDSIVTDADVTWLLGGVDIGVVYNLFRILFRLTHLIGVFGKICRRTLIIAVVVICNAFVTRIVYTHVIVRHKKIYICFNSQSLLLSSLSIV